ncbi:uncharacterized protein LOC123691934 [Colias croceus]|uniref:uncharacterized protein LOC123691934 n=1 Tax=Colias crocea TaxID=72248 RepID=UPI001E27D159|nr:uncharacterized protein LOC123691934 [Colias croceus]
MNGSGLCRTIWTTAVINAVQVRIRKNPVRNRKQLALQMGLSSTTVKKVLNEDLGLRAYCRKTSHLLNTRLKKLRLDKCRALLKRYARKMHRDILFSDEKFFTVEECCNKQNIKVYTHSSEEACQRVSRVQRGHHPLSVMVFLEVSYFSLTEVFFCEKAVKTSVNVYQNMLLTNLAKPPSRNMLKNQHWVFQQDSAPAHKAKSIQSWLAAHQIDIIRHEDWSSSNPDLNPGL